jgi:hypothetical protein
MKPRSSSWPDAQLIKSGSLLVLETLLNRIVTSAYVVVYVGSGHWLCIIGDRITMAYGLVDLFDPGGWHCRCFIDPCGDTIIRDMA